MTIEETVFSNLENFIRSGKGFAGPFVPYVGPKWRDKDGLRLMYCGKATAGEWNYGTSGERKVTDAKNCAQNFVREKIIPKTYTSAFWHFATDLMSHLYDKDIAHHGNHEDRKFCFDRFCWTNVTKLALTDGNLPWPILEHATELMAEILKREVDDLKPDAIVFVTSGYGDDIINAAGLGKLNEVEAPVQGHRFDQNLNCHIFKTRHPQGWKADEREAARDFITSKIKTNL